MGLGLKAFQIFKMFKILVSVIAVVNVAVGVPVGETAGCGTQASSNLIHQNPWAVYLEYLFNHKLTRVRCGGTLVDRRHVVTAAHCLKTVRFDTLKVRLGEYNVKRGKDCVEGVCTDPIVVIEVESFVIHPSYNGKDNDIAVLTLKHDAPFTDFIRPACLPTSELPEDAIFTAAGWGVIPRTGRYSAEKKSVKLPYFSLEKCQKAFGKKSLPTNVICAGGQDGIDMCSGDSGGPLVWGKERAELRGVISSGSIYCGTPGIPGIYTKVDDYNDWLDSVINGKQ